MLSEIGSDFWECSFELPDRKTKLWWESKDFNCFFLKSGRNAIKALANMIKTNCSKILLPIYTCETVITPFLDEGWEIDYYKLNTDLSINIDYLFEIVNAVRPTAILFHSYFGFNTYQHNIDVIEQLHEQGIIIVEDITQSLFSNHYIKCADYFVSSLRKFIATPDGGVLFSRNKFNLTNIEDANLNLAETAKIAFKLKKEYMENFQSAELKSEFRDKYSELNKMISDNKKIQNISRDSKSIFLSCDINRIKKCRAANFKRLVEVVKKLDNLQLVIEKYIGDETPLYLPIYVENNRKQLQDYLASNNVYCPVIWPQPKEINNLDEVTDYMYKHMLCIPIDQRYGSEEMDKISTLLMNYDYK